MNVCSIEPAERTRHATPGVAAAWPVDEALGSTATAPESRPRTRAGGDRDV